ncbi:hypothetical protein D0859_04793 [Hortaea werneckii]|uniref:Uncharacterized protein n=1 Tax=Hortaea werneckii TaxID=91943 RepID=A0A3M7J011_HORWE|nr:hypothetical protein D0859_04793 [Hortaea werneckii]
MSFAVAARLTRASSRFVAATPTPRVLVQRRSPAVACFSTRVPVGGMRMPAGDPHDPHHEESFEEFTARGRGWMGWRADGRAGISGYRVGMGGTEWKRRKRLGQVVKEEDKRRTQPVACRQELSCGCCMQ